MAPREPYPYAAAVARIAIVLALFVGLFLGMMWTPGLLLSVFAAAYAAHPRAFSQAHAPERRLAQIRASARRYRGGWVDSPARQE